MIADWLVLLAAPLIGSFLGVLVRRLPARRALVFARSRCAHCDRRLAVRELVPMLSFALQRGRCRTCGDPIGWFYPAIEIAAVVVVLLALGVDSGLRLWADCLLGWTLLAAAWIDAEHLILPDALTLPLVPLGIAFAWHDGLDFATDCALGAALGYSAFSATSWVYRRLRGRDGLGEGDAKLLAVAGAWLGWQALPGVVLVASVLGIVSVAVLRLIDRQDRRIAWSTPTPFAPALALAIWIFRLVPESLTPHLWQW